MCVSCPSTSMFMSAVYTLSPRPLYPSLSPPLSHTSRFQRFYVDAFSPQTADGVASYAVFVISQWRHPPWQTGPPLTSNRRLKENREPYNVMLHRQMSLYTCDILCLNTLLFYVYIHVGYSCSRNVIIIITCLYYRQNGLCIYYNIHGLDRLYEWRQLLYAYQSW